MTMLENSKVYLWDGYVFPCEDVVQVVDYVGDHLWLPDVPEEEFDEESSGYRLVQDYPVPEHVRVYDSISKEWHWLDDFDIVLAYEYHNGNSWQIVTFPEHEAVKEAGISDTQRYKQAGNAVTVNVVEAIGRRLIPVFKRKGGD